MNRQEREYYTWATQCLEKLRGAALNLSTDIEFIIGDIIAMHFCRENVPLRNEFLSVIINSRDLTFSSHIEILSDILKHSYPNIERGIMKKVDNFRAYRNKFAHCRLDLSKSSLEELRDQRNKIRLSEIKGREVKRHDYIVKEHIEKIENDRGILDELFKLRDEIIKKDSNQTTSQA